MWKIRQNYPEANEQYVLYNEGNKRLIKKNNIYTYISKLILIKIIAYLVLNLEICFSIIFCSLGLVMGARFGNGCNGGKASRLQLYWKETPAQVFSWESCKIFHNTFFQRTPPVAASEGFSSYTNQPFLFQLLIFW